MNSTNSQRLDLPRSSTGAIIGLLAVTLKAEPEDFGNKLNGDKKCRALSINLCLIFSWSCLFARFQNIIRLLGRLDQRLTEMNPCGKTLTCTVDGQQVSTREVCTAVFSSLLLYFCCRLLSLGSLSKHDVAESENVIWKCDFAFLQSFFNYSQSLCLKNVL